MPANFYESYRSAEIKPPSERSTGLVFSGVAALVALLRRDELIVSCLALGISLAFAVASVLAPPFLRPLTILWFRLGLVLHRIVNPAIMFVLFALVFVPAGMLMRLWRDPLRSRRQPGPSSYWIDLRERRDMAGSMTDQF